MTSIIRFKSYLFFFITRYILYNQSSCRAEFTQKAINENVFLSPILFILIYFKYFIILYHSISHIHLKRFIRKQNFEIPCSSETCYIYSLYDKCWIDFLENKFLFFSFFHLKYFKFYSLSYTLPTFDKFHSSIRLPSRLFLTFSISFRSAWARRALYVIKNASTRAIRAFRNKDEGGRCDSAWRKL